VSTVDKRDDGIDFNGLVAGVQEWLTQVPTATLAAAFAISSARAWAGVFHPRVLRGRLFISLAM
jgi:hypothetical protein